MGRGADEVWGAAVLPYVNIAAKHAEDSLLPTDAQTSVMIDWCRSRRICQRQCSGIHSPGPPPSSLQPDPYILFKIILVTGGCLIDWATALSPFLSCQPHSGLMLDLSRFPRVLNAYYLESLLVLYALTSFTSSTARSSPSP